MPYLLRSTSSVSFVSRPRRGTGSPNGLPGSTRNTPLTHLVDNIGLLVAERLVPAELVAGYMGTSILDLWERLAPHIYADREVRRAEGADPGYQFYFEHLAETMKKWIPLESARS